MELYPLKLKAVLKDYIWGGTRLRDAYGKQSDLDKVAESWEMSVHPDGPSTIVNGPAAGMTLPAYLKEVGQDEPPILIKLIDAHDNLSVQVHPDNEYAQRVEGEPGSSMALSRKSRVRNSRRVSKTTRCWTRCGRCR